MAVKRSNTFNSTFKKWEFIYACDLINFSTNAQFSNWSKINSLEII